MTKHCQNKVIPDIWRANSEKHSASAEHRSKFFTERKRKKTKIKNSVTAVFFILIFAVDLRSAFAFLVGAVFSILAGFLGMVVATKANVRTAEAARHSQNKALRIAFSGGAVMGLCVVGLGVIGIGFLLTIFSKV